MASQKKILLMDDDEFFRDSLSLLLKKKGYQIVQAATIKEAEQILEHAWVHMVIVDLSMTGADNDRSGLQIVDNPTYASVAKVILTGHGEDPALIRQSLKPNADGVSPVVDFIDKRNTDVEQILIEDFERQIDMNWDLQIHWSSSAFSSIITLAGLVVSDSQRAYLLHRMDELEDLLCRFFVHCKQITIGRLLAHTGEVALFEVFAQDERGTENEYIVACGQQCQMRHQLKIYDQFAPKNNMVGNVRLVETVESIHFTLSTYECIGGVLAEMAPLQELYLRRSTQEISEVLSNFFDATLTIWHGHDRSVQKIATLKQFYQIWINGDGLQPDLKGWMAKIESLCNRAPLTRGLSRIDCLPEQLTVYVSDSDETVSPNPIQFLFEENTVLDTLLSVGCVLHNLQLNNILADVENNTTWVIEFSRAQIGPILLDYIALESALKAELLRVIDIGAWYSIEKQLMAVESLDEQIIPKELSNEGQKILSLIGTIRKCAMNAGNRDLRTYRAGLFVYALAQLRHYDSTQTYSGQDIASYLVHLLSAATACPYLISAREFKPNLKEKSVLVEGRKISNLTKQEWQILELLYKQVGQQCAFEDILRDVYEDASDDISNGAWMRESGRPKVNAAIRRLRRKLEPNPENPRYIYTEREHGYRLEV